MSTDVPGNAVQHTIITPNCRTEQFGGSEAALERAIARIRDAYARGVTATSYANADWHLVLTVEWDKPDVPAEADPQ